MTMLTSTGQRRQELDLRQVDGIGGWNTKVSQAELFEFEWYVVMNAESSRRSRQDFGRENVNTAKQIVTESTSDRIAVSCKLAMDAVEHPEAGVLLAGSCPICGDIPPRYRGSSGDDRSDKNQG